MKSVGRPHEKDDSLADGDVLELGPENARQGDLEQAHVRPEHELAVREHADGPDAATQRNVQINITGVDGEKVELLRALERARQNRVCSCTNRQGSIAAGADREVRLELESITKRFHLLPVRSFQHHQ
jgi:hypothetical protein